MKVCVVGGGSTYTPELVEGLLMRREQLDLDEIHLVDVDADRLSVLGPLARRMSDVAESGVAVRWGTDRLAGCAESRFVVSQIRVGGMAARERDEQLGREFGLIGQETVGVGGFANALRTIPVALEIAADIAQAAPGATLLNFTNPAGLVTEALCRHSDVATIGLCNVPWAFTATIARTLGVDVSSVALDYVGLNHLSWVRRVTVGGIDRTQDALDAVPRVGGKADGELGWSVDAIRTLGALPNPYLLYYYETAQRLAYQASHPTRASAVMAIKEALIEQYADPLLARKPPELSQRGGAYYSEAAAALMADLVVGTGAVHVVNTPNRGAIPGLDDDVVVEVAATIGGADGVLVSPIPVGPLRPDVDALMRTVKDFELLTVQAAIDGDHESALRALVTNPLGPSMSVAPAVWARLRELNAGFLGRLD